MTRAQTKKQIEKLRRKRRKRAASRKKHYLKYERFRKRGRKVRRNFQFALFLKDRDAVRKLDRLIEKNERRLEEMVPASGTGPWGGSDSILVNEVEPLVLRVRGVRSNSGKRVEDYGNPGSDHHVSQTTASARDFPLVSDYEMAGMVYSKLTGNPASQWPGDYASYYIERAGRTFRCQGIADTHGTGPHCHIGIRLL